MRRKKKLVRINRNLLLPAVNFFWKNYFFCFNSKHLKKFYNKVSSISYLITKTFSNRLVSTSGEGNVHAKGSLLLFNPIVHRPKGVFNGLIFLGVSSKSHTRLYKRFRYFNEGIYNIRFSCKVLGSFLYKFYMRIHKGLYYRLHMKTFKKRLATPHLVRVHRKSYKSFSSKVFLNKCLRINKKLSLCESRERLFNYTFGSIFTSDLNPFFLDKAFCKGLVFDMEWLTKFFYISKDNFSIVEQVSSLKKYVDRHGLSFKTISNYIDEFQWEDAYKGTIAEGFGDWANKFFESSYKKSLSRSYKNPFRHLPLKPPKTFSSNTKGANSLVASNSVQSFVKPRKDSNVFYTKKPFDSRVYKKSSSSPNSKSKFSRKFINKGSHGFNNKRSFSLFISSINKKNTNNFNNFNYFLCYNKVCFRGYNYISFYFSIRFFKVYVKNPFKFITFTKCYQSTKIPFTYTEEQDPLFYYKKTIKLLQVHSYKISFLEKMRTSLKYKKPGHLKAFSLLVYNYRLIHLFNTIKIMLFMFSNDDDKYRDFLHLKKFLKPFSYYAELPQVTFDNIEKKIDKHCKTFITKFSIRSLQWHYDSLCNYMMFKKCTNFNLLIANDRSNESYRFLSPSRVFKRNPDKKSFYAIWARLGITSEKKLIRSLNSYTTARKFFYIKNFFGKYNYFTCENWWSFIESWDSKDWLDYTESFVKGSFYTNLKCSLSIHNNFYYLQKFNKFYRLGPKGSLFFYSLDAYFNANNKCFNSFYGFKGYNIYKNNFLGPVPLKKNNYKGSSSTSSNYIFSTVSYPELTMPVKIILEPFLEGRYNYVKTKTYTVKFNFITGLFSVFDYRGYEQKEFICPEIINKPVIDSRFLGLLRYYINLYIRVIETAGITSWYDRFPKRTYGMWANLGTLKSLKGLFVKRSRMSSLKSSVIRVADNIFNLKSKDSLYSLRKYYLNRLNRYSYDYKVRSCLRFIQRKPFYARLDSFKKKFFFKFSTIDYKYNFLASNIKVLLRGAIMPRKKKDHFYKHRANFFNARFIARLEAKGLSARIIKRRLEAHYFRRRGIPLPVQRKDWRANIGVNKFMGVPFPKRTNYRLPWRKLKFFRRLNVFKRFWKYHVLYSNRDIKARIIYNTNFRFSLHFCNNKNKFI